MKAINRALQGITVPTIVHLCFGYAALVPGETKPVGYSFLLKDKNTTYVSGSTDAYNYVKGIYNGGVILSIAFGYAF